MTSSAFPILNIAPAQVIRGSGVLTQTAEKSSDPSSEPTLNQALDQSFGTSIFARLGRRPLVVGGDRALAAAMPFLSVALAELSSAIAPSQKDCTEAALAALNAQAESHQADFIIGVGGGKMLDAAKLLAYQRQLPVATVPTSAATCAGWTALSNVYSDEGAFLYDVSLPRCPDLLVLDYDLVATAPRRMLIAGIGDAIAKWYESSISSGHSTQTMVIGAVQQARVLRDILFQKSAAALAQPNSDDWREVVDASVLMAGVIGGMGGAQCRTVAAHAVHNGLTHVSAHGTLHGEKVAYGILVQLRLEELGPGNALAATARQQLLQFYSEIGLPKSLADMGMDGLSVAQLQQAATVACRPGSDIHHLPFAVSPDQVMAAMVSTTAPTGAATGSVNKPSFSQLGGVTQGATD